jgi:hypothetical protein
MGATRKDERLIGKAAASNVTPDQAVAQYVARLNAEYGGSAITIGAVRGMIDGAMGKTTLTELLYKSRNEDAR